VRTVRDTGTRWDGRPVDIGAAYFTVSDPQFAELVNGWEALGIARPWTDTLATAGPDGLIGSRSGPVRWAAPNGLRSLVEHEASELTGVEFDFPRQVGEVTFDGGPMVDGQACDLALLCAPDPQVLQLLSGDVVFDGVRSRLSAISWEPALAYIAVYEQVCWPDFKAAFVNGSPILSGIADDGSRRGDGAAVLVAHSTGEVAAANYDEPMGAESVMREAVNRVLGITAQPVSTHVHRWGLARPIDSHSEPHLLDRELGIGVAGDSWFDGPKVETAWLSGRSLGTASAELLS